MVTGFVGAGGAPRAVVRVRSVRETRAAVKCCASSTLHAAATSSPARALPRGFFRRWIAQFADYDPAQYLPFMIGNDALGSIEKEFALELQAASPDDEFVVELERCEIDGEFFLTVPGSVRLHPRLIELPSVQERSDRVERVLRVLQQQGAIQGWRNERQPVVAHFADKPFLEVERAAVPYLGCQSFGTHINGYVRRAAGPQGLYVWLSRRSRNKPTYAGRLDQMVAGGQPVGLSLSDNVLKECEEEATLRGALLDNLHMSGVVSYRYSTRKGLSTKTLFTYDIELPGDFEPVNSDGEVEAFMLVRARDALVQLTQEPDLWKPNSALVFLAWCVRHGVYTMEDDPDDWLSVTAALHPYSHS
ncbi:Nudix hydrolase 24, chloroplastic [Porphyridium purpureum]|uniref:Nudix hydrolase 24, chloroplastic n=1 Tax=Porphyridium purpureum TaxID=35688 RepID=A0A5J4YS76_PORPP|nr:Nudix hydrolase 24, chloroplastic [Porphyridium purpureum]|eukprot:POR4821..scf236_6